MVYLIVEDKAGKKKWRQTNSVTYSVNEKIRDLFSKKWMKQRKRLLKCCNGGKIGDYQAQEPEIQRLVLRNFEKMEGSITFMVKELVEEAFMQSFGSWNGLENWRKMN